MTKFPKRLSAKLWRTQAHRVERNRAMLLLRFGCAAPAPGQRPLRNYRDIAQAFCVSPQLVRKVCLGALAGNFGFPKQKDPRKQLERQHIRYLLQHYTLKRWIGQSLDERAALFMRKFPEKELTGGQLWHLYRKHGIKYKCVAVKKMAAADKADQIMEETKIAYHQLRAARKKGEKVVYCDEVMFTKHTGKLRDWSAKGCNTTVAETSYYTDYRAVVAGISSEAGVEVIYFSDRAITQVTFSEFLRELREQNG